MTEDETAEMVRGWVKDLLDSVVGEIGVSWEKWHKVINKMETFVKETEQRDRTKNLHVWSP